MRKRTAELLRRWAQRLDPLPVSYQSTLNGDWQAISNLLSNTIAGKS